MQHCYDLIGEFFVDWLVALVTLAEGDGQFGNVGAGPIEACLEQDIALARLVESRVPQEQLRAVLRRMWFSDASPEVKQWALRMLKSANLLLAAAIHTAWWTSTDLLGARRSASSIALAP